MKFKKLQGFSLIEVMIALLVISILAAIAYPSYQDSVRKNGRTVAKAELMKVLARQEQHFVNSKGYATDLTTLGYVANGFYLNRKGDASASSTNAVYKIELASGASTTAFTLNAVPVGSQTADSQCSTLTLSHTGAESATGSLGAACW